MMRRSTILALKQCSLRQFLAQTHAMEQGLACMKYLASELSVLRHFFLGSWQAMTKGSEGARCDAIMAKRMRKHLMSFGTWGGYLMS